MDAERRQAIIDGRSRYFTGRPCAHGHVAERGTVNGQCVECARLARQTDEARKVRNRIQRAYYRRKHPKVRKRTSWNAGKRWSPEARAKMAAAAEPRRAPPPMPPRPIVGVMDLRECTDKVRGRGKLGKAPKPIVGVMDVRERADAARSSGQIGTLTTARPKPIVGTFAATDFADNDAQPIRGRMATVDPRDVAKFLRWRDGKR